VISRVCSFQEKAEQVQLAGAKMVIIFDTSAEADAILVNMVGLASLAPITIPVFNIAGSDGYVN
jgi:hypothetical protein